MIKIYLTNGMIVEVESIKEAKELMSTQKYEVHRTDKICVQCGNVMTNVPNKKKYCSDECVKKAKVNYMKRYWKGYRPTRTLSKKCPVCGKMHNRSKAKYCSATCTAKNNSEKALRYYYARKKKVESAEATVNNLV